MGWIDAREFEDANAACTCSPGRPRRSLRSSAPTASPAPRARSSAASGSSLPGCRDDPRRCRPVPRRRAADSGSTAPARAPVRRSPRSRCTPPAADRPRASARAPDRTRRPARWVLYVAARRAAAAPIGPLARARAARLRPRSSSLVKPSGATRAREPLRPALGRRRRRRAGGIGALVWIALKVGALAFGGGFVIIPLMQNDAVTRYHWMTNAQFLNAVALGPGHARAGRRDRRRRRLRGRTASPAACSPRSSRSPPRSRSSCSAAAAVRPPARQPPHARAFLDGAGPAAIGAILGAAITLATALTETWQFAMLAVAAIALLIAQPRHRRDAARGRSTGVLAALVGATLPS